MSRMADVKCCQPSPSVGLTGDGDIPLWPEPSNVTSTRASSITSITRARTVSGVSPGRIRKLTLAVASIGSTLALMPPLIMVAAVVVRIPACACLSPSKAPITNGLNSQRFFITNRLANGISSATASKKLWVCLKSRGNWSASRAAMAAAKTPMEVCSGGMEE